MDWINIAEERLGSEQPQYETSAELSQQLDEHRVGGLVFMIRICWKFYDKSRKVVISKSGWLTFGDL